MLACDACFCGMPVAHAGTTRAASRFVTPFAPPLLLVVVACITWRHCLGRAHRRTGDSARPSRPREMCRHVPRGRNLCRSAARVILVARDVAGTTHGSWPSDLYPVFPPVFPGSTPSYRLPARLAAACFGPPSRRRPERRARLFARPSRSITFFPSYVRQIVS